MFLSFMLSYLPYVLHAIRPQHGHHSQLARVSWNRGNRI
jgi:hypothetical protein